MKIYLDLRTGDFYKKVDRNLPPEFFCIYELGPDDIIVEHYEIENGDRLDYSYSNSLRKQITKTMEEIDRRNFFEKHLGKGYAEPKLISITIPKDEFISYCEEAGFDDYVNQIMT